MFGRTCSLFLLQSGICGSVSEGIYCIIGSLGRIDVLHTLQEGKYGLIRPIRFVICNQHVEWEEDEFAELVEYLDLYCSERSRFINVDELPLPFRQLISSLSGIQMYQPNTRKTCNFTFYI